MNNVAVRMKVIEMLVLLLSPAWCCLLDCPRSLAAARGVRRRQPASAVLQIDGRRGRGA